MLAGVCLCLLLIVGTWGQASVPPRPVGYSIGNDTAPVHFDAFLDFLCPYSAASYPTLKQIISNYGPDKVKFTMYVYPLPYHHNAFYAAQSGAVVVSLGKSIWDWTELIFKNQAQWFNYASIDLTANQVIDGMATLATQLGISKDDFNNQFPIIELERRAAWSVGAARGVYGSPLFYINGAFQWADSSTTFAQWKTIIDNIIESYNKEL
uniref:Thioredoxin-like fold domain-containing protein n=1 Tax=Arcella intermedia TaxID=1963864 RepID=A0A6B2LHY8_9EUKA